jgi:DNA-binding CsgD family transcriptional regulator
VTAPTASSNRTPHPSGPGGDPQLLERDAESAALRALGDGARGGRGACVVVAGAAGIGKTTLLARVGDPAAGRVLRAAGAELEDDVPFGVVRDLLGPLAPARGQGLAGSAALCAPVFDPAAAVADAGAVLHGLYWLVADAAERRPLTLVVDDVQWADPSSLRFLLYLARRVQDLSCLLVLGLRAGPRTRLRAEVQALADLPGVRRVELAPLSAGGVAALMEAALGGAVDAAFADAGRTATGGNPLLCVALAAELARAGVRGTASELDAIEQAGGSGAAAAVRRRVARCGEAAAQLALAVAVLGPSASYRRACALARLGEPEAGAALDALVGDGVLQDGGALSFPHPIVRSAVLDDAGAGMLARWHARAAHLVAADDLHERAAHHLRLAEPLGDPVAVALLRRAAALAAGRGAPEAAVAYLVRALEEPPSAELRAVLLHELGVAESHAGLGGGIAHLEQARDQAVDRDLRVRIAGTLGDMQMWAGRWRDAVGTLEDGIAAADGTPAETVLHGQLLRAAVGSATVRRLTGERLGALRSLAAAGLEDRYALGFLAVELAMTTGPVARVAELADGALQGGDVLDGPAEGLQELIAIALALADEPTASLRAFDAAVDHARRRGSVTGSARAGALRGWALLRFGRPAEAEADAAELMEMEGAAVLSAAAAPMAVATLIGAALECRGVAAAVREAERFAHLEVDPDLAGAQALPVARAQVALADLRPEAALAELEVARRWEQEFGGTCVGFASWRPLAASAHLLLGDRAAARALAAEQQRLAEAFGGPTARGVALHAAALVERDPAVLEEAVAVLRSGPARSARVRALIDLGAMLRGQRQLVAARTPLREALDLALAAGALGLAERAREELLAAGARPRRVRSSGVHALTPAELRTCRMAAEGLTNRQIAQASFVSPRTVEMHLSNAYRKLGAAGREQLAELLGELGSARP